MPGTNANLLPETEATMGKPDLSTLESMITSAETNPTPIPTAPGAGPPAALRASRERVSTNTLDALARLGMDRAQLDQLRSEHAAELRRFANKAKRDTIERSAEESRRLTALVASQRAALDVLPVDPWGPGSELLLSVDFIRSWPTPANLRDWHQEPGLNWAKYAIQDSGGGVLSQVKEKVSFYIVWQNRRNVTVLADILVRLTVNGHCECNAEGLGVAAWFFPHSRSRADISAQLTLWGLWTDPAPQLKAHVVPLETLSATGGFLGDTVATSISAAPAVVTTGFAIPAQAFILIEASIAVDYEFLSGSVDLDFASTNLLGVGCPYAVVTLPPATNMNP
jgi:hypothetical protein